MEVGSEHPFEFANPQEQLELAALVNRFGNLTPNEFDPDIHVTWAREIVKALAPKIRMSSARQFRWSIPPPKTDPKAIIVGATDLGEVKTTMGSSGKEELSPKLTRGRQEIYRIGTFMVTKFEDSKTEHALALRHFLRHGISNQVLGKFPPFWVIHFDPKSLEPRVIKELSAKVKKEVKENFWGKEEDHLEIVWSPSFVWSAPQHAKP